MDVEHLTLLWQTWDSSTLRGKRCILEASRPSANRQLQNAKQGTAAPGKPLWKENKGNLSCKKPEHMGIIVLHFLYIWKNIVEQIKDHCNIFLKMTQTTELTKTLCSDQRGKKMPLSTGGASGSSGAVRGQSQRDAGMLWSFSSQLKSLWRNY